MRIFIADDHALIREGLKKILRDEVDLDVVGEAGTASEILQGLHQYRCDFLILDLALPDKPGLEVLKEVKAQFPHVHVLILSAYPEDRFAVRTLKAGADGYLAKDSATEELVVALRRIAGGRKYFSDAISQELAQSALEGVRCLPHELLSDREFQVLCMIGSGKSVSDIAADLNISISTVNTHRAHILEKMHMETSAQLIRYTIENRLID